MPRPASPTHRHAALPPVEPQRFMPTRERPVRAKSRHLEPDTDILPHSHAWAQVVFCASGVARITAGQHTYLVPAWRAVWIPPHVEHVVTVIEAAELRTLYLHQEPDRPGPGVARKDSGAWRGCRVLEVSPLLRELVGHLDTGPGGAADEREACLGALVLDELRRAAPVRLGLQLPRDKRLRSLCEAVLDDPLRHATLEGWAHEAGASARTMARLFRHELGTTFGEWRQQVRLARALTLASGRRPMAHIAAELGYASPSAFSAMVRRTVGATPRSFLAARP